MMHSNQAVADTFTQVIRKHLQRLRNNEVRFHLPQRWGLHSPSLNAIFHATPELFIQTGGATDFICPGERFRMNTGDMCIMPRGLPHAETPIDLQTPYQVLVCGMGPEHLYIVEGHMGDDRRILSYPSVRMEQCAHPLSLIHYLDEIADYLVLPKEDQQAYVTALLEAFLLRLLPELNREPTDAIDPGSPLVTDAMEYIRTHLRESKLSVGEIAKTLGCTPDHLSRQFHQTEGMKLMTWLARERVALAKHLLTETKHNIAEVGWASGFNSPSYFIRIFRRHTEQTPRSYRLHLHNARANSIPDL